MAISQCSIITVAAKVNSACEEPSPANQRKHRLANDCN